MNLSLAWLVRHPVCWLGFGFGTGLAPKAPGTFGTLPALPLAYLWLQAGASPLSLAWACIPLFVIGIYICGHTERAIGRPDYGGIVWDEIVAMLLVLAWVPFTWWWWLAAFGLFRVLDALKPWPIKWFDARVHGGFGIMLDDVIAALFAIGLLQLAQSFWPW